MADLYLYRDIYHLAQAPGAGNLGLTLLPELLRLADLRTKGADATAFVEELLLCVRNMPAFAAVDRICLAQLAPGTSMLTVLGSVNSARIPTNPTAAGYHCFITDGGSLTKVREGWLRQFRDAQDVVASFKAAGAPPQRTIRLIAEMGHRSGVCIPIEQHTCSAFLFMNSVEPGIFDNPSQDIMITMGLIAQFARVYITLSPAHQPPQRWLAQALNWGKFNAALQGAAAQRFGSRIGFYTDAVQSAKDQSLLWCPDAVVRATLEAAALLVGGQTRPHRLLISLHPKNSDWSTVRLRDASSPMMITDQDLAPLRFLLAAWQIRPEPLPSGGIDLIVPTDGSFFDRDGSLYSI